MNKKEVYYLTGLPETRINQLAKRHNIGRIIKGEYYFTEEEAERLQDVDKLIPQQPGYKTIGGNFPRITFGGIGKC